MAEIPTADTAIKGTIGWGMTRTLGTCLATRNELVGAARREKLCFQKAALPN
jgi:hypothetical protein